jgi:RHS repeat-associated protein
MGFMFGKTFGETASQSGAVSTDTRYCTAIATGYTGQREEVELGLYFYNARWYDPYLGRFTQADTIVPNPVDAKAFDRYAYVYNNPVRYNDPSGHEVCYDTGREIGKEISQADCWAYAGQGLVGSSQLYSLEGDHKYTWEEQLIIAQATMATAKALANAWNAQTQNQSEKWSPVEAFLNVFGGKLIVNWTHDDCGDVNCWGEITGQRTLTIYGKENPTINEKWIVHELGHMFDAAADLQPRETLKSSPSWVPRRRCEKDLCTDDESVKNQHWGFAGPAFGWQQSKQTYVYEDFADMFLGWVYGEFGDNAQGEDRIKWLATNMFNFIDTAYRRNGAGYRDYNWRTGN